MRIGVPGEFHEDRWQRTAEDSERRVLPHTREVCGTHRIQVISWQSVPLASLRHGDLAHRCSRGITAWRRGASGRSLARRPCPQVHQGHPRVAKHHLTDLRMVPFRCTSRSSARRVGPQVLQRHHGVAKRGFWTVFGTAALPTGAPEASRRGKGGFWAVFGTATPPIGAPEASSRGEGGPLSAL